MGGRLTWGCDVDRYNNRRDVEQCAGHRKDSAGAENFESPTIVGGAFRAAAARAEI